MKRVLFAMLLGIFTVGMLQSQKETIRPNVVLVLADDIGLGDISGYRRAHSENIIVETPEIDKLMRQGMIFTDAHAPTALCAPSRYSIMTGNNSYHSYAPWGVWGSYQKSPIKSTDLTLGKLMQRAGYRTAFFGKWHLGGDYYEKGSTTKIYRQARSKIQLDVDVTQVVSGPKQQGFEYSFMFPAGIQDVPYIVYENQKWFPLNTTSEITQITQKKMDALRVRLDKDEGLGDSAWNPFEMGALLANKAVTFIQEAESTRPFFIYYCSQAVHKPHTPVDVLDDKTIKGSTPVPHLDMVAELDAQMGMLVKALKEKGVFENTLFIFTSDNGGLVMKKTLETGHRPSDIYRGGKNQIYEGGHRVPLIAVWPNRIQPNTSSDALVSGTDILATLGGITDQSIAEGQALDSFSMMSIFLGEKNPKTRKKLLIQGGTGRETVIRDGFWKLIIKSDKQNKTTPMALYNLNDDPREKENLIENKVHRARIKSMYAMHNQVRYTKVPTNNF